MASAGTLSVDVQAKITDFIKGMNTCTQRAQAFSNTLSERFGKTDVFDPFRKSLSDTAHDMRQITFGIVFAQGFYTTLSAIQDCTKAVYEYADSLNYAKTSFANLFKDTDLAEEFVAVMQQYAAKSPFDFGDVKDAATQLKAYGIQAENLMFVLQGIGNLATVTGEYTDTFDSVSRAIGQINAKGVLRAQEMLQLAEAGLNVKAVYEELGVSASDLADANIDAATAINAIVDVMNSDYEGALDAANSTVRGMIGNIKDALLSVSAAIIQPLYNTWKSFLSTISSGIDSFQALFQEANLATAIEQTFGSGVLTKVEQFMALFANLGASIVAIFQAIQPVVSTVGQSLLSVFIAILNVVSPVITSLSKLFTTFTKTATGSRVLQAVLAGLITTWAGVKAVTLATAAAELVLKGAQEAVAVASAISAAANAALAASQLADATATSVATAAWSAFNAALGGNVIVRVIALITALTTALLGLQAVMGSLLTSATQLSNFDAKKFLNSIKGSTGDLSKFNNRLSDTNSELSDMQDNLAGTSDAAEDAVEGLLSFDEVFSLPEQNDPTTSSGSLNPTYSVPSVDTGDFGIDLPSTDELFGDWEADLDDYFINLLPGIFSKYIQDFVSWCVSKVIEKFKTQLSVLPGKIAGYLETGFKKLPALIEPSVKEVPTKIAGYLESGLATVPEKIGTTWEKGIVKLIEEGLARTPIELSDTWVNTLSKYIQRKLGTLEGISGEEFISRMSTYIEKFLGSLPQKIDEKWASDLATFISTSLASTVPQQVSAGGWFSKLASTIASKFANLGPSIVEFIKTLGWSILFDFIFDGMEQYLKDNGQEGLSGVFGEFANELSIGLATFIVTKNPFAAIGSVVIQHLFDSIGSSIESGDWTEALNSIFSTFSAVIVTGATKLLPKLLPELVGKVAGGPLAIGSIIADVLFGGISAWFEANGDSEAASISSKVGGVVSDGLAGAGLGAMIGNLFLPGLGALIGGAIGGVVGLVVGALTNFWDEISTWWNENISPWWEAIWRVFELAPQIVWGGFTDWLGGLGESIGTAFETTKNQGEASLKDAGEKIIQSFSDAAGQKWEDVSTWFAERKDNITGAFTGAGEWLTEKGSAISQGLSEGIQTKYEDIKNWFTDLPNNIKKFFSTAVDWLQNYGEEVLQGLLSGVTDKYTDMRQWFVNLPSNIKNLVSSARDWLTSTGRNIISGLFSGLQNMWSSVISWFYSLPSSIQSIFSNAGDWLWNAGWNIVSGLLNGLVQRFWDVIDTVSGWGQIIVNNKGPEEYDKKLLIPAGQFITGGLLEGLQSEMPAVMSYLNSIGAQMSNAIQPGAFSGNVSYATASVTPKPTSTVETVPNPFLSTPASSNKPVVYVQNMIANKQGLRDLKKQLDIVEREQSRWS